jgi:hypothetical protein
MGLFGKKQEVSNEKATKEPANTKDGKRGFIFGRSKPAPIAEELPLPPSPWAPESSSAQRSNATSALTSRRNSFTSVRSSALNELKYEAMVNHLFQQQCSEFLQLPWFYEGILTHRDRKTMAQRCEWAN